MDLTQPLSSIAPSLDGDTLTVLARTAAPLTGRGVASLVRRGSQPRIQAILDRLVSEGLVDAQPAGSSVLYALNREHLLAEPVVAAATARETLLDRMQARIGTWAVPPLHVSLFGSLARATAGTGSDVDLLVVRPDNVEPTGQRWAAQLSELEGLVLRWTGNHLSWFETTRDGLVAAVAEGEPVVTSWRSDAVHLFGARLARLLPVTAR